MNPTNTDFVEELLRQFKTKVSENWETLYTNTSDNDKKTTLKQQFGDFDNKRISLKAAEGIRIFMFKSLLNKFAESDIPVHDTIYNHWKKGISPDAKVTKLDPFAAFCGYIDWDDFKHKNRILIIKNNEIRELTKNAEYDKEGSQNAQIESNKHQQEEIWQIVNRNKRRAVLWISGIVLLLLVAATPFIKHWYDTKYFSANERKAIEDLIRKANDAEFEVYRRIPKGDTVLLDDYFVRRGPGRKGMARGVITSMVERSILKNQLLSVPPSSYRIISIEPESKTDTSILVNTHEYWLLRWRSRFSDKDTLLYDIENRHLYQLLKEGGKWKIDMDKYDGKPRKLEN